MEPIKLHFPPKMVLQYAEKIASDAAKDEKMPAAQLGMIQDIVQMVRIACNVMKPTSENTNQKS